MPANRQKETGHLNDVATHATAAIPGELGGRFSLKCKTDRLHQE